jgi:peptide/nickel transport system permease protein
LNGSDRLSRVSQTGFQNRFGRSLKGAARLIRANPIGALGALIVLSLVAVAVLAPWVAPYDPTDQGAKRFLSPSTEHPMGTDSLGRDVASRLIYGTRVSLYVGLISVSIALVLGTSIGVLSGYFGGRVDSLLMRLVDMMLAFPGLVLALLIAGLLGPSLTNTMIAVGIINTPTYARVARGSLLALLSEPYIEAARSMGGTDSHIIRRHLLPNMMVPLIVLITVSLSTAILAESSLSFLGLGVQPPDPSWGGMLSNGRPFMEIAPWVAIFPGMAIALAVLGFNLLGDGLRDVLDPRLKEGRGS